MTDTTPDGIPEASPPPAGRARFLLEVVLVRVRFLALFAVVGLVAGQWDWIAARWERWTRPAAEKAAAAATEEFFCPMHPQIVRDAPGSCPICGMPLSRRAKGEKEILPEGVLARVQLSPYRIALGGIRTSEVGPRPLAREVSAAGSIEVDERRMKTLAARVPGRIDGVFVDFTGVAVKEGDPLVSLFSPDLVSAEEALLASARTLASMRTSGAGEEEVRRSERLLESGRQRLLNWGLAGSQIDAMLAEGRPGTHVTVRAPLSGTVLGKSVVQGQYVMEGADLYRIADLSTVWLRARLFAGDLGIVEPGREVRAVVEGFPGEEFLGKVAFVDPVVDPATRTVGVRMDLENPAGRLRPGMYAKAFVRAAVADLEPFRSRAAASPPGPVPRKEWWCPMHPEVTADHDGATCPKCNGMPLVPRGVAETPAGSVLAVPEPAVVDTGTRTVVYRESAPGVFDATEVVLGPRADGFYPVLSGLAAGDRVVAAGAFLVDAETRLNPAAAAAYFGATGAPSSGGKAPGKGK